MKKHLIMALVALVSFSFISCGDDDDEITTNNGTTETGTGTTTEEQAFNALKDNQIYKDGKVLDLSKGLAYYESKNPVDGKVQYINISADGGVPASGDWAHINMELGINWFGKNENLLSPTITPDDNENKIFIQVMKMYQMAEWPTHEQWFFISANYGSDSTIKPGLSGFYFSLNADKSNIESKKGLPLKQGKLNCWKEGTTYYVHFMGKLIGDELCAFKLKLDATNLTK